jgi:uncharacterized protein YdeI (YjbR/CyaY-like superfamily)
MASFKAHCAFGFWKGSLLKDELATFTALSASHQREYLEWFGEAKTAETRHRPMTTALEWLSEGKARNWKYERRR